MYPQPPYVLFIAGLLAAIASGAAFNTTLQQSVKAWNADRTSSILPWVLGPQLKLPYLGICAGICVFLASGIQLFGFSSKVAYAMGIPLTALSALLVWYQLNKILLLIEKGGSQALDLDGF